MDNAEVKVTENGKGSDYGFYSVSIKNKNTGQEGSMDITKKAGYPIWFINYREVSEQKISLNDANLKAAAFLKENGYKNLELFESTQYDNTGVFNFVTTENNIRIYPEAIKVEVALDNGDIIGFSAEEYLKSLNDTREVEKPVLTSEQAREKVNPNFKIMEERQSIIVNDLNKEVLCYEFLGTIENDTYRIFINAVDGVEEEVEKLKNAEEVYDEVI